MSAWQIGMDDDREKENLGWGGGNWRRGAWEYLGELLWLELCDSQLGGFDAHRRTSIAMACD